MNSEQAVAKPDHRTLCKYGDSCYQTNPMHLEKFRHPDKVSSSKAKVSQEAYPALVESPAKKMKLSPEETDKVSDEKENESPVDKAEADETDKAETSGAADETSTEIIEDEEAEMIPESPEDLKESIKQKFLVSMPPDFFHFWNFCKEKNHKQPEEALLSICNLRLVGPFEVLSGKLQKTKTKRLEDFLAHFRYYYDVPEFQTVLASTDSDFHIGYFYDDPKQPPAFVASNDPEKGCKLNMIGDNLFAALYHHVTELIKNADPFKQTALQKFKESIHVFATMKIHEEDVNLDIKSRQMKARDKLKLAQTFHGAGMVVPYNKETQVGYREIPETTASLKKIFKNVIEAETESEKNKASDVLHELVTNVQFANDEGDPGMGLELGLNAFCFGGDRLHSCITHLLQVAYDLLQRPEFGKKLKAHLKRRQVKGCFKIDE